MRRRAYKTCSTLVVLLLSGPAWAQVALKPSTKDLDGNDRYQLSLEPHRVGQGDDKIVSWRVQLIDPRRRYLGNYLVATKPPEPLSDQAQDRAWWLDPSPYAVVPLLARRVFKVESFYCVIQVEDYHKLSPESRLLDSMNVEVQLTQTDPRHN